MDNRFRGAPSSLTSLRTEQWLSHFRLGDKYAEGDFRRAGLDPTPAGCDP
ncbi:MAG: hypothetical protein R3F14_26585 [Polyangiaceae bacterium]